MIEIGEMEGNRPQGVSLLQQLNSSFTSPTRLNGNIWVVVLVYYCSFLTPFSFERSIATAQFSSSSPTFV
uniref:Uncharacterized protein n=1 Tax=Ditylenchus dipsaci TaxID=166011 RepID=A0A915CQ29_9BILA